MIFKKSKAVYIEKMNYLKSVTVSSDKVKFELGWSNLDMALEDVPKLLSDLTSLYGMVKPELDRRSEEKNAEEEKKAKENEVDFEPIDLSNIPF